MVYIPPDSRATQVGSSSPYAALAARARRTSQGALTAAAAVGVLALLALTLWRPAWWTAALPLVSLGAFGWWGILERERAERYSSAAVTGIAPRALRAAQWLAVAAGTASALLAAFALLGLLFGTVIS